MPRSLEGCSRPIAVALTQKRQVEQPFAGIIKDLEAELGGAAGGSAQEARRGEPQRQIGTAHISRARRPMWRVGRKRGDRFANWKWSDGFGSGRARPDDRRRSTGCGRGW